MAQSHADPTFRSYAPLQASKYAEMRTSYPLPLYNHILEYHSRTFNAPEASPGEPTDPFGLLLDVGCGPGNATRDLALAFKRAVGVDPGEEMIKAARGLGGQTNDGGKVQFEVCTAEACASVGGIEDGSVDLLVAAMAAHWFDMPRFWEQAAHLVRPGGTVALWTVASNYAHPETPHAAEVNRILLKLERETLAPFEAVGNRISRDMYDNLTMPWTADPAQKAFPRELFHKDEWDRDGVLTDGKDFFGDRTETTLERLEEGLGTASMVTRWRAAHPELVGTEKDCVRETINALRPLLGGLPFKTCGSTAILFFKRA